MPVTGFTRSRTEPAGKSCSNDAIATGETGSAAYCGVGNLRFSYGIAIGKLYYFGGR